MRILVAVAAACLVIGCGSPQALPKGPPPEYEIEGVDASPMPLPLVDAGAD